MRFLIWLTTHVVSLAVATWVFAGIRFSGPTSGSAELHHKVVPLVVVALILGVITSFVRPALRVLSFPLIVLSLGFFLLVINALLLFLTSKVATGLGVGFHVHGFWTAVGGSIVITLVTWLVDGVIGDDDDDRRRARR